MPLDLSDTLVVGITTTALFDMTEPNLVACMHKVFSPENVAAAAGK